MAGGGARNWPSPGIHGGCADRAPWCAPRAASPRTAPLGPTRSAQPHRGEHPLPAGGEGEAQLWIVPAPSTPSPMGAVPSTRPLVASSTAITLLSHPANSLWPATVQRQSRGLLAAGDRPALHDGELPRIDHGEHVLVLEIHVDGPRPSATANSGFASSAIVPITASVLASTTVALRPRPLKENTRRVAAS